MKLLRRIYLMVLIRYEEHCAEGADAALSRAMAELPDIRDRYLNNAQRLRRELEQ